MISFCNDSHRGIIEITMFIETWRVMEFFWKIINRISLKLGKGWYFIDCGYCDRKNGKMICLSQADYEEGKECDPVECHSE